MTGPPAGNTGLLAGLSARLQVDSVVYVDLAGRARVMVGAGRDANAERAERSGRQWLADRTPRREFATWHPRDSGSACLTPLYDVSGEALGVVVAVRGEPWSPQDLELFQFTVDSRAFDIDDQAAQGTAEEAFDRDLAAAIDGNELRLDFQPEYDLRTHTVAAVEALVRWEHPEFGELGPESFIATAERSDAIGALGAWVIDRALWSFARWRAEGLGEGLTLRMNVSPVQAEQGDLETVIVASLAAHDVPGNQVCIELTENVPLRDPQLVADLLFRLKSHGVSCAIDDLATGYSTLSNLRLLPFDVIKIDRSLVSGIDRDIRARSIVAAIVGLARSLRVGVVAEGVETDAELAVLPTLGCHRAQGHLLARPMDDANLQRLLGDQRHHHPAIEQAY